MSPVSTPTASTLHKRRLLWLALIAMTTIGLAIVYRLDPATTGHNYYPPCLIRRWTGLYCAGCGATRATHALLHGDVAAALRFNPLFVVLVVPVLWWALVRYTAETFWPGALPPARREPRIGLAILALALAFSVSRNLPYAPFVYLSPPTARGADAMPAKVVQNRDRSARAATLSPRSEKGMFSAEVLRRD